MKSTVLIVEDEAPLVTLLRYNLEKEGFAVCSAGDGEEALLQIAENKPDAVLLDWMLPLVSGLEVCRQIRRSPSSRSLPIILLTARGEEADRVRGLDSGADDYIVKPFSPSELVARLRAVIRRAQPSTAEDTLHYADVAMDLAAHRVSRAGRAVHLGPTEFRLLHHFLLYPGRVFSREHLLDRVWGPHAEVEMRTVDVHIRRLRKALNIDGCRDLVRTVRSVGYALDHAG
ncbi:MAG TPA: phosphate regulon transcriptional regulator PhoB [Stellaceae bacterium]|jgi:two-component system phosphate regulon response regulator PhoB|nr:phosphate regulon transcriptional regulator PhoB [Stellaceae bacterium]